MIDLYITIIIAIVSGISGFVLGSDGFLQKTKWINCRFEGIPPKHYESWKHFTMSKVKSGVTVTSTDV